MLLCSACRKEAEPHDNAAFVAVPEPETSTYDLDQIQETGELIVATVSGPDTYYDYHGQILGYQYLLATHFAQHIGARLRVELCRDTLELMQTLERGDVDIVAYPLTFTDIGKADLVSCGPVNASDSTSWAVRHDTPLLAKALRSWYTPGLGKKLTAEERTQQKERSQVRRKVRARYLSRSQGIISPYDQHFKAAARVTGWDWKLIAAQCYQESGFDPDAVSWAGAQGLMQIMPTTAQHLGLSPNLVHQPAENIAAAARYIRELSESFREVRDGAERIKFVLAAYNGGYFHIRDAMALCRKYGKNPTSWLDVSFFVRGLSLPKYYRDPVVKYGYMIGDETYNYVASIMDLWRSYGGTPGRGVASSSSSLHSSPVRSRKKNRFVRKVEILQPDDDAFNIDEQP